MKQIIYLLIATITIAGCQDKNLEGTWIDVDENNYLRILKFEGDKLTVKYLNTCDTFNFEINNGQFTKFSSTDTVSTPLFWSGDSIFSWDSAFFFKRLKSNPVLDSSSILSQVNITLPEAEGVLLKPKPYFDKLYAYYVKVDADSVNIEYGKTKFANELDLVQSIEGRRSINETNRANYIIFADKDCKYKHISKLKNLFRYCRALKVTYAVRSDKGDFLNSLSGITMRLPPLSYYKEKEVQMLLAKQQKEKGLQRSETIELTHQVPIQPPLPPLIHQVEKKRRTLIEVYDDSLVRNKQDIDIQVYLSKLKQTIKHDHRHILFYHINKEATYGGHIQFLDKTFQVFYELRNEMALNDYNKPFKHLNDSIQSEIKRSIPLVIIEIYEEDLKFSD